MSSCPALPQLWFITLPCLGMTLLTVNLMWEGGYLGPSILIQV